MNKKYFHIFILLIVGIVFISCTNSGKNPVSGTFNGLEKIDDSIAYFIYLDDEGGVWYGDKDKTEVKKLKNDLSLEKTYKMPGAEIGLVKDGNIWAFQNYLLAKSENNGETWECFSKENYLNCNTLRQDYNFSIISSIISDGGSIFIGTYNGIYRSRDQGTTWERIYFNEKDQSLNQVFDIISHNQTLYASAEMAVDDPMSNIRYGILESKDSGYSWERSLVNDSIFFFAGGFDDRVYAYSRPGNTPLWAFWAKNSNEQWKLISYLPNIKEKGKGYCDFKFAISKTGDILGYCSLLVSEYKGGDFPSTDYLGVYLIKSHDNGNSWESIDIGDRINFVFDLRILNSGDILLSTDQGIFKMIYDKIKNISKSQP